MREILKDIEVVGATMIYQEGSQCCWALDWLYDFCDRVLILLDNHDDITEQIAFEYRERFPDRTFLAYSTEPAYPDKNIIRGQIKRRFKLRQDVIREQVFKELKRLHLKKPIDLLIFPDSDETFINCFPEYLETFWSSLFDFMMVGFFEPFDSFQIIMQSRMAPHGRIYKYKPEITNIPWKGRTQYLPYYNEKRPWKLRHVVAHNCWLTEEYRQRRCFFENSKERDMLNRPIWFLPKDVREMRPEEIAEYQPGAHGRPPIHPPIKLGEYLMDKEHYINKYNIKLWN